MKIRVVGCDGGVAPGKLTVCFQISESLLVDAGSVATGLDLSSQKKIRDIFISHNHIDHIKDLAFLADNLLGEVESINLYALPEVHAHLKKYFFNNQLWPDFTKIPAGRPFFNLVNLEAEKEYAFGDVVVQPVLVDHAITSLGFIVKHADGVLVISGDTGPTKRLWELSKQIGDVKHFFVEVAFPQGQQSIADSAKHFSTATLREELAKFDRSNVPISLYHLKPRFVEEIQKEVRSFGRSNLKFLNNGEIIQL